MSDDDLASTITSLGLSVLIAKADRDVLLTAIELIGQKIGVETIEGLSIPDWFWQQRVLALEHELVSIEDQNPEMAAMLQEHLDKLKSEGDITNSE